MPPLSLPLDYLFLGLQHFTFRGFCSPEQGLVYAKAAAHGDRIACKLEVVEPCLLRGSSEEDKLM